MDFKTLFTTATAILLLAVLVFLGYRSQKILEDGLPARDDVGLTQDQALQRANAYSNTHGGPIYAILGTGSMAPYIPPSKAGLDPKTTTVAYAVGVPNSSYTDIQAGNLCVYMAEWDAKLCVIHSAAQKTYGGWVMSGLHNARSESWARVTPQNFRGIVARVFVWTK